jgi:hypothetical protein
MLYEQLIPYCIKLGVVLMCCYNGIITSIAFGISRIGVRYKTQETARIPQSWRPSAKMIPPPKVDQALSQSDPISLGSTPRHPANQSSFHKGQIA